MLILLFDENARAPLDPVSKEPVSDSQSRLIFLVASLSGIKSTKIVIPTPSIAELLVRVKPHAANDYLSQLHRIRGVKVAPFSERAAIEFAEIQRGMLAESKASKEEGQRRSKPKFDQQIVAIAKTEGASRIYSDDLGLEKYAKRFEIETIKTFELPLPPIDPQGAPLLEPPEAISDD